MTHKNMHAHLTYRPCQFRVGCQGHCQQNAFVEMVLLLLLLLMLTVRH
jgi:hypothetical protein